MGTLSKHSGGRKDADCGQRLAVGYVRVSTEMQAADGLSLDAQTAAIEQYCAMQGLRLVEIHRDVLSGGKSERPGLQAALRDLQKGVEVLVVLKFDRLCVPRS